MSPAISKMVAQIARAARRRAATPPIGAPGGIASLEQVTLNGYPQWLLLRGQDTSKPVLLFLHGGPGSADMWHAHHAMRSLEEHFVCVSWDQRGAGKSLAPGPDPRTMTIAQFVADTMALLEILRARFRQEKVLLVGHSWGSVLAMKVAAARPDLLHAVVGMGQVVDMARGEEISYRFVLERARAAGNDRAVRALEKIGPPPYAGSDLFVQRRWLSEYHGDLHTIAPRPPSSSWSSTRPSWRPPKRWCGSSARRTCRTSRSRRRFSERSSRSARAYEIGSPRRANSVFRAVLLRRVDTDIHV